MDHLSLLGLAGALAGATDDGAFARTLWPGRCGNHAVRLAPGGQRIEDRAAQRIRPDALLHGVGCIDGDAEPVQRPTRQVRWRGEINFRRVQ